MAESHSTRIKDVVSHLPPGDYVVLPPLPREGVVNKILCVPEGYLVSQDHGVIIPVMADTNNVDPTWYDPKVDIAPLFDIVGDDK